MKATRPYFLLIGLCLILACNLPSALTAEATPTASPTATSSLTPTQTRTPLPTATLTPTPMPTLDPTGPATATANEEVACLGGPTNEYPLVFQLSAGESIAVIGKAFAHWILKPDSTEACWVDAQFVAVRGVTSGLTNYVIPPLPVTGPPAAPARLKRVSATCSLVNARTSLGTGVVKFRIEYLLTWEDNSKNEDGFYIYRDYGRVAEVPANTTRLIDSFTIVSGGSIFYYYVVAYNSAGQTQGELLWIVTPCR